MVDELSKHIVVACRNQFYWFDIVWKDRVTAITERELLANLKVFHQDALKVGDTEAASNAVGVLTTERRAKWANLRAKLQAKNKDTLAVIDRALYLVSGYHVSFRHRSPCCYGVARHLQYHQGWHTDGNMYEPVVR